MTTRRVTEAKEIRTILLDPRWRVRPEGQATPEPLRGSVAGNTLASFARFSDHDAHAHRKRIVIELIAARDSSRIGEFTHAVMQHLPQMTPADTQYLVPGMVMARLIGVPLQQCLAVVQQVRALVTGARPTATEEQTAAAIRAMECTTAIIAAATGESDPEVVSGYVSLIFQSSDAMAALIGNALVMLANEPDLPAVDVDTLLATSMKQRVPVRSTTRMCGDIVAVIDLEAAHRQHPEAGWTFGFGPHACPGRSLAFAIASAVVTCVIQLRPFDPGSVQADQWEDLPNVWIPILKLREEGAS